MATQQVKLGDLGEIVYQLCFGGELSNNRFDSEKDLTDDTGANVEIKTQRRFIKANCFTVNKSNTTNLRKCLSVEKLIFVEYDTTDMISIYECTDRNYFTIFTYQNKSMACFPIENMTLLRKIKNHKLANLMRECSSSKAL